MIIRNDRKLRIPEGEYRGVWSGNKIILLLPNREVPVRVDDSTSRELDVIAVVVGGYMIAETLQNVEVG
jgi:hypothetical protein